MFLEKLPDLELAIMKESVDKIIAGLPLLECLRCFRKVKLACFGQKLQYGYKELISNFSKSYRNIGIKCMTITPKVHIVIVEHHVVEFFNEMGDNDNGLGWYSEQAFESMHHDMKIEWNRVKISDISHPDFGRKLLSFVTSYNAKHI